MHVITPVLTTKPGYTLLPAPLDSLPLGAVVIADPAHGPEDIQAALLAHQVSPWAPVALVAREVVVNPRLYQSLCGDLRETVVVPSCTWDQVGQFAVLASIRERAPSNGDLLRFILRRTRWPSGEPILTSLLDPSSYTEIRASPARYRRLCRRLSHLGPLSAADWRVLFRLSTLIPGLPGTVEELARRCGIEARTLRKQVRRLLGSDLNTIRAIAPWEALLETGLRLHGYVKEPLD